ncbi:MAG: YfhO family protein [Lachnospiraceae bacterium]|nr:YfhO family protein [Lachnospiraceae bacterium]
MTFRKKTGKALLYAAAFFLPVLLCALVFLLHGIAPFGDNTIMTGDAEYQFVDYFSYLKTIVFGNNDFFYSFSKNLGGSLTGFSAYYYLSPVNLLTLFFSSEYLPLSLSAMYALTLGLCSLSFFVFLSARFGARCSHLIFSLSYAFMGFLTVYFQLTMYYSGLIIFPLLMLGVMSLAESGKYRLYLVCLFLTVVFNYYAAFMQCIFSLLMFAYTMAQGRAERNGRKETLSRWGRFIGVSLSAVLLSAFTLLPALLSLGDEKNSFSVGFFRLFPLSRLFSAFYTGSFKGNVAGGLPNLFCGVIILLLAVIYFFNSEIPPRERILSGAFLTFLLLNLWLNPLNVAWHGFNQPIGFPFRYSYMVSFLIIYLSCRGCEKLSPGSRPFIVFGAVFALYSAFLLIVKSDSVGIREVILTGALLALGGAALALYGKKRFSVVILGVVLLVLNAADLSFNFYDVLNHFELASLAEYRGYVSEVGEAVDTLREEDTGFYRMDKYFRRTHNDAMQFDYAGLSHFSSSEKKEKIAFMGRLGFRNNGNWAFYSEPTTVFLDSFFGVKYLLSRQHSIPNDYEKLNREGEIRRYRNNSALPLMFVCNREIRSVDSRGFYGNPFALQEAIADSMNGEENHLLIPAEIKEIRVEGLDPEEGEGVTVYRKTDPEDMSAGVEYRIAATDIKTEAGERANLFAFFDAPRRQNVALFRYDDNLGDYFDTYRWNIVNLEDKPREEENGEYFISLRPRDAEMELSGAYFYYEDRDRSAAFFDKIRENACELNKITSSHLTGSVAMPEAEGKCVVLSIPFDTAWNIYVDGKRTESKRAADMLLSFDVPQGTHGVELFYRPRGIKAGMAMTILTLLVLLGFLVREKFFPGKEEGDGCA